MKPSHSKQIIHGTCVQVLGSGVLITGTSGIGKTECALELVARGGRLVADDAVHLFCEQGELITKSNAVLEQHAHLRDVGIVDVATLFGEDAICKQTRLDVTIDLVAPDANVLNDESGLVPLSQSYLGISLPYYKLTVTPTRSLAFLVDLIVRAEKLKAQGDDAAVRFQQRQMKLLAKS